MIYANYHTHTPRCNHASGSEREYVETAIEAGMKVLGFSDHTPYFAMPREHYSDFRMFPEQAKDYFDTINGLKEEYKDKIKILTGAESEFYPAFFGEQLKKMKEFDVDYFILGQHFVDNEIGAPYTCVPFDDEEMIEKYVNQVCRAMDTDAFSYIAHPDIVNFTGEDSVFEKHMSKLCEHALEKDIPLEINLLGLAGHRHYPSERFFKIAGETGNTVVLGCDAHSPSMLKPGEAYDKAMEMVGKYNLNLTDYVRIKDPKKAVFEE